MALAVGTIAFALATAGLVAISETVEPAWRDPEFGYRLRQIEKWRKDWPDRPLVLILGSSRVQMGISPAEMALPDGPTDPLIYNFGYRGALPLWSWMNLLRLLDHGIRPQFVVVQLALAECGVARSAEEQLSRWTNRISSADVLRLHPYANNTLSFPSRWIGSRLAAWQTFAECIRSDVLREWDPEKVRRSHSWEIMDRYGFVPLLTRESDSSRREERFAVALQRHARSLAGRPVSELTRRVHRDLVDRCAAEGIRVALAWAPESPRYRSENDPAAPRIVEEYSRFLSTELGAEVFPAAEHLAESDFVDGYHLLPAGATTYSRWLAETHLKNWFARHARLR